MLVSLYSDGKCNWVTKLRLLLHETGFCYVWLTHGVGDELHFIRIFRQRLTDINCQEWVAGLNASSRFDLYREFKTALNAETYLDCIKQKSFRDCLVRIRLGISNLKVHKNRYAMSDILLDNDCPFCPGMQDNELHMFFVFKKYEKIKPNMLKNTGREHSQFVKLMSCQADSVTRQMARFLFKCFETRHR